jgi:electron transfer flavoprotein alpha subunit
MNEKQAKGIWVFVEINHGEIHASTFELLGKAQALSQSNHEKVTAILLETPHLNHAPTLIGYGADQVIVVKDERFNIFNPTLYKDAVVELAKKYEPAIFLFAATYMGRSLAPRIQGALDTGLTADCLDLSINEKGQLVQIKPSYGDNLMCTILIPEARPQMTTVRPFVFTPLAFDGTRQGEIIEEKLILEEAFVYEVLEQEKLEVKAESLAQAKHVVAVGRGIKKQENLTHVEALAKLLNAKVGVTRPLAENGWYSLDEQIGQSGHTIQPDLILNFGIAGAVQYTVGMKNSKFVFSVNSDADAGIFKESDYGYVGDAKTFAQELIKAIEKV